MGLYTINIKGMDSGGPHGVAIILMPWKHWQDGIIELIKALVF